MGTMQRSLRPGMTENDLWAILHAENIRRGGEWIETRLLASGPRTNPWFQESSARVIEDGDIVAFDTDLVGPYGYCCDISRAWLAGDRSPSNEQRVIFAMAEEQMATNMALLKPGTTFRELSYGAHCCHRTIYRTAILSFSTVSGFAMNIHRSSTPKTGNPAVMTECCSPAWSSARRAMSGDMAGMKASNWRSRCSSPKQVMNACPDIRSISGSLPHVEPLSALISPGPLTWFFKLERAMVSMPLLLLGWSECSGTVLGGVGSRRCGIRSRSV